MFINISRMVNRQTFEAVVEVLKSDFLTQGPNIKIFEDAFAKYVGAKYAIAVSNGTAALHLNAMALDVKPGDKVITTPITFVASANCVRYCGGEVVFADIDPETYLLDINKVRELLVADSKKEIKGIIPVNFAGTHESLTEATEFVKAVEKRTSLKIACVEEIALTYQWITKEVLSERLKGLKGDYYEYIKKRFSIK